jgi:hypothetical protein
VRIAVLAVLLACACSKSELPKNAPRIAAKVPAPDALLRVGGDVKPAQILHRVDPVYPKGPPERGFFIVEAVITKDGKVREVRSLKGADGPYARAIMNALKASTFRPGTLNGKPVDVIYDVSVFLHFR